MGWKRRPNGEVRVRGCPQLSTTGRPVAAVTRAGRPAIRPARPEDLARLGALYERAGFSARLAGVVGFARARLGGEVMLAEAGGDLAGVAAGAVFAGSGWIGGVAGRRRLSWRARADVVRTDRLIPVAGIRGQEEQEKRATSSLLAVMHAVPEFGRGLIADLGAPKGRITTYLDWARDNDFDAVLTISNQITPSPQDAPLSVDGRKLRKVKLYHLSWWRILTDAIVQHRHRGVSDPDQAWLLGELIAYLDHEKSGASGFQDMGDKWVTVRTAAANETLRAGDPEVEARLDATVRRLIETGKLDGSVRVPDAIGDLAVEADLRTRRVTTSVRVSAPREGRPKTRINWMLRQLRNAPDDLRLDVSFAGARETTSLLLGEAREAPERLLSSTDPRREPRAFQLALTQKMGTKRGKEEGSFVRETRRQAIDFYRDLVQDLRPWQASAP